MAFYVIFVHIVQGEFRFSFIFYMCLSLNKELTDIGVILVRIVQGEFRLTLLPCTGIYKGRFPILVFQITAGYEGNNS